tara:strand:+ start:1450 stop:1668 length:219 start_codon:yes stop_codon:yes gene_type:complete
MLDLDTSALSEEERAYVIMDALAEWGDEREEARDRHRLAQMEYETAQENYAAALSAYESLCRFKSTTSRSGK